MKKHSQKLNRFLIFLSIIPTLIIISIYVTPLISILVYTLLLIFRIQYLKKERKQYVN